MGVRVDTYANVKANLQAVTDVLVSGGMPPTGPLPDADRQLFQTWVDQGALNNLSLSGNCGPPEEPARGSRVACARA